LFNKAGTDDTIKVAIRIRPLNKLELEKSGGRKDVFVEAKSKQIIEVHDKHGSERKFGFDRVLDPGVGQDVVFDEVGRPMVDALLEGETVSRAAIPHVPICQRSQTLIEWLSLGLHFKVRRD